MKRILLTCDLNEYNEKAKEYIYKNFIPENTLLFIAAISDKNSNQTDDSILKIKQNFSNFNVKHNVFSVRKADEEILNYIFQNKISCLIVPKPKKHSINPITYSASLYAAKYSDSTVIIVWIQNIYKYIVLLRHLVFI